MKLFDLFEDDKKSVAFCFGRMNPPTIGHRQVFDTLAKTNKNYRIFVSPAQTPKKDNPLDFATKVKFIKAMFPQHAAKVSDDAGLNTVMKVAVFLFDQGYTDVSLIAGSDRLEGFEKLLNQYNGVESAHGFYKFDNINLVSSGDRDPDAEGLEGISASAARQAARDRDLEKFAAVTGAGDLSEELYKAVRLGLGIKENVSEAPIEMDPEDPMNPMIVGTKSNPAKLKYRMARAAGQLKDLASRVDGASPSEWQTMSRQFEELRMNMEEIRHALAELAKRRSKGGKTSRGIDPYIDTREDAAGVGIITKQNTTKDVNKGTLHKMMKGYKLI
jgi:hypothetical protein